MNLRNKLNDYPRFDPKRLIQKIKDFHVVSFDVFDTLLKRDVAREQDVFALVERQFNRLHSASLTGFCDVRVEAERSVRRLAGDREITLQEIYEYITKEQNGHWKEETVWEWMTLEREVEGAVSCPNLLMKEVYQFCLDAKKEILIVSDMYLERSFIAALLDKNGYRGYRSLYVSSDIGKKKRDGSLFQHILSMERLKPDELIHIGDGKKADYFAPKQLGIHTAPIARRVRKTRYLTGDGGIDQGVLYAVINNRVSAISDRQKAIGYEVYGPLLYGFVKWLNERLDPKETVLFFARDCYAVIPAYRMLLGNKDAGTYFEGSRKSLIAPALWLDSSLEHAVKLLRSEPQRITFSGLLRKFGLDDGKYAEVAQKHGFSAETVLHREQLTKHEGFIQFWKEIEPSVKADSEVAYRGFQAYFQRLNCTEAIQVVDIGWRCTMQYCMQNLLQCRSLRGYYLGVREDAFVDPPEREGFFLSGENDEKKKSFLASITALFEIFFSAPHGSVVGYTADGEPLHAEYECAQDQLSQRLVKALHDGALEFVNDFANSRVSQMIQTNADLYFTGLREMGNKPCRDELIAFGNYPFRMGVGVARVAAPDSLVSYALHPKRLLYDFANSNWKIAFMKRLLKVNLPYDKIFEFIYQRKA